ncbi:hypothetical protein [Streptomyces cylindrosporus]|uniref:Uncharacterized protein n=1 Tax=Streptomyces cylindrosporus TaxID=2927583 RepID=A0ABS9Y2H1_9ACTN|nr:hypothetical protein [Streptomyces cylindrosporus]MCI3271398.1 hypothetical protein [Streptomyces cylindrosporus]
MAIYQRGAGDHIAERVQPEPGSEEEQRLEELVARSEGGWHRAEDEAPAKLAPKDPPEGGGGEGSGSGPEDVKPPARSASKADWVAYAVAQGADQAEAEGKTRDQLVELFADGSGD